MKKYKNNNQNVYLSINDLSENPYDNEEELVFEDEEQTSLETPNQPPEDFILTEDEEEDDGSKKSKIMFAIAGILGVLAIGIIGVGFFLKSQIDMDVNVTWNIDKVEYGSTSPQHLLTINDGSKLLYCDDINTKTIGEQTITARLETKGGKVKTIKHTITVQDTQKPTITTTGEWVETSVGGTPDYSSLNIQATDPVDGQVSWYIDQVSFKKIGNQTVTIVAEDFNGNKTEKKIHVRVTGGVTQDSLNVVRSESTQMQETYKAEQEAKKKEEEEKKKLKDLQEKYNGYSESVLRLEEDVRNLCNSIWEERYTELVMAALQWRYQNGYTLSAGDIVRDLSYACKKAGVYSVSDTYNIRFGIYYWLSEHCSDKDNVSDLEKCILENDKEYNNAPDSILSLYVR